MDAVRRLTRISVISTVAFAILVGLVYFVLDQRIGAQVTNTETANLIGRQRMLSQHVLTDALRFSDAASDAAARARRRREILDTVSLLEEMHVRLMFLKTADPGLFAHEDALLRRFLNEAKALLAAPPADLHRNNPHLLELAELVELPHGPLIQAMDKVASTYADRGRDAVIFLQKLWTLVSLVIVSSMVLAGLFVFLPLVRTVREGTRRLAASELRLHTLFDSLHDGIVVIDDSGTIQSFSPAAVRIFGYQPGEVIGENVKLLMPEPFHGDHDAYLQNYKDTSERKVVGIGKVVRGKRKNGTTFPLDLAVTEMHLDEQRLFTGIIRDISDSEQTLEKMRLQSAALEAAGNSIFITDHDGVIGWVNPAFTDLTGYTASEAIGKTPAILNSGQQPAEYFKDLWNTIGRGNIWHGEVVNRRKDGTLYTEEETLTPLTDENGQITHFIAIKQDISERKVNERALAASARKLALSARYDRTHGRIMELFSSSYEQESILREVLKAMADAHPFPVSAVYLYDEWSGTLNCAASQGAPPGMTQELGPGEGLVGQAAADQRTRVVEAAEDMPLRIETGLLKLTPAAVIACPIVYNERVMGVLVLAASEPLQERDRDFVERLGGQIGVALNNIRQYHDLKALSEQLSQRGREIVLKNTQLEQANRLKTEFLANMSHELRTPLNAIIGFSEVLKDGLLGEMAAQQLDYVGEIFGSANHLLSLINDILDLSKIEAGKMELHLEPVSLPDLLGNSLSIVKEKAHTHAIQLKLEVADDVGELYLDARKFKQIVFNLLSNAVKFTPDGGRVGLAALRDRDRLRLSVSDSGIGIPADQMGSLFRPFEQLDGSLSRKYEGTGLGLVMVKRLAELHGGSVSVQSKVDEGSQFTIEIPYRISADRETATAASVPETPEQQAVPVSPSVDDSAREQATPAGPTVLLVEDNDNAARLMEVQLKAAGYRTLRAGNGLDGLTLLRLERPALVILDILLPDIDGWQVLSTIKGDPELAGIPVVVVSIVADSEKGLALGAMSVLEKPLRKDVLLQAISHLAVPDPSDQAPVRVLVVDDEVTAVEFVSTQLEERGYQVLKAYGGRQAIDLALQEQPDLLILDLMMPEVNGFDVVAELRQQPSTRDIPIIILTAKTMTEEDRLTLNGHVCQVLEKSRFDPQVFMDDVSHALGRQTGRRSGNGKDSLVLVVDDDQEQSKLLKLYLEDAGFRVVRAINGKEALERMAEERPQLITLDLLMPKMDGFAFLEAKNRHLEYSNIPVVVLSAITDQLEGHTLSAEAVLAKPIRRQELLSTVKELAGKAARERPRVLVVDDDPKAIKIITSYLPKDRFEVLGAFGGGDGLELARMELPDVILLDLMMPDMSGFEVLMALRKDAATRDIPVIVLTAKILTGEERRKLENQVALVVEKGQTDHQKLLAEIQGLTERYCK